MTGQRYVCSLRLARTTPDLRGIIEAARNRTKVHITAMEPTIAVAHRVAENASDLRNPFNVCPLKRGSIHMTLVQYDAITEHTERSFRSVPLRAVSLFGPQLLGEAW